MLAHGTALSARYRSLAIGPSYPRPTDDKQETGFSIQNRKQRFDHKQDTRYAAGPGMASQDCEKNYAPHCEFTHVPVTAITIANLQPVCRPYDIPKLRLDEMLTAPGISDLAASIPRRYCLRARTYSASAHACAYSRGKAVSFQRAVLSYSTGSTVARLL